MKAIHTVIKEDFFLESHKILIEYLNKSNNLDDVNLILTKKYIKNISNSQLRKFYVKYIQTGLIYALPEFFTTDIVYIPKGVAGVREYRFFSSFGLILYNSLGIFFTEMCNDILSRVKFEERGIFSYAPTRYIKDKNGWKVNNKWHTEYNKFKKRLESCSEKSDAVLHLDISKFFNSINHKKLINIIDELTNQQKKTELNFNDDARSALEFYLLSIMGSKTGLPQGRKNFASDYLAYVYLSKFDINIRDLLSDIGLDFVASVRYVDDIYVFFRNKKRLQNKLVYKNLSNAEHKLSKWLQTELNLNINSSKTIRQIISKPAAKEAFLDMASKTVSSPTSEPASGNIDDKIKEFAKAITNFQYPDTDGQFKNIFNSKKDRENLKHIFNKSVQNIILKPKYKREILDILGKIDFELSAEQFYILATLFHIKDERNPFFSKLLSYFEQSFNPKDKRHIHILFFVLIKVSKDKKIVRLIRKYRSKLAKDDYGKYLVAYLFKNSKKPDREHWINNYRVYSRIYDENAGLTSRFPFIKNETHPLSLVLKDAVMPDPLISSIVEYVHEFMFENWSVAFNKLQMIFHELVKFKYEVKDKENIEQIIRKIHHLISIDEERMLLQFFDRRNFNPVSHRSKNGITAPEVTKAELIGWERKVFKIIHKII